MSKKLFTNCIVQDGDRVLLGMKKRGFALGHWNGFGGKVNPGEDIEAAAIRELFEESGIKATRIKKRGLLIFTTEIDPNNVDEVHVFSIEEYEGSPVETEEMNPKWYSTSAITDLKMWPDNFDWMPIIFSGNNFIGKYHFKDDNWLMPQDERLISKDLTMVEKWE